MWQAVRAGVLASMLFAGCGDGHGFEAHGASGGRAGAGAPDGMTGGAVATSGGAAPQGGASTPDTVGGAADSGAGAVLEAGRGAGGDGGAPAGGSDAGTAGDAGDIGGAPATREPIAIPAVDEAGLPEPVPSAGFIELEATRYRAQWESETVLESSPARLFYNLIPADDHAKDRPIFVFFNGGPGSTTAFLATLGTGPNTLDAEDPTAPPAANPNSLSRFGNLLYIDARNTGFSYLLSDEADVPESREQTFDLGNFNGATDGADFVRVLLRVLAKNPALRNNRVVLVGESYGGLRASVMLSLLLDPNAAVASGAPLVDPALSAEIEEHYRAVFPGFAVEDFTQEDRASQFGWQVLIQPWVGGLYRRHRGSASPQAMARMVADSGLTQAELGRRCPADQRKTRSECEAIDTALEATVTAAEAFQLFYGAMPDSIPGLRKSDRARAFRFGEELPSSPVQQALSSSLGELEPWDAYFGVSMKTGKGFDSAVNDIYYLIPFVTGLRFAHTLITNAEWDAVVLTEAIPFVIRSVSEGSSEGSWLAGVEYEGSADLEHATERFHVRFNASAGLGGPLDRTVYFPFYPHAGHMVPAGDAAQFAADVHEFMAETGLRDD